MQNISIHLVNRLNGATREMGPNTISELRVRVQDGKIVGIYIDGRAQTSGGVRDDYVFMGGAY